MQMSVSFKKSLIVDNVLKGFQKDVMKSLIFLKLKTNISRSKRLKLKRTYNIVSVFWIIAAE